MKLTRDNYEIFMLDYLEGNLNKESVAELMAFLKQHPDLEEELRLLENHTNQLPVPDPQVQPGFEFLKKPSQVILDANTFIAALEGDLSEEEQAAFDRNRVLYPAVEREFSLYQKTKLEAPAMVFPQKKSLYKKQAVVFRLLPYVSAIAAVFITVALLGYLYYGSNQNTNNATAEVKPAYKPAIQNIAEPKTAGKTEPAVSNNSLKQSPVQHKIKTQLPQTESNKQYAYELSGHKAEVASLKMPLKPLQPALLNLNIAATEAPDLVAQNQTQTEYLSPVQWVRLKVKEQIPENPRQLVQKTAGITMMEKKDSSAGVKSFSLVTRYFAYERITHP